MSIIFFDFETTQPTRKYNINLSPGLVIFKNEFSEIQKNDNERFDKIKSLHETQSSHVEYFYKVRELKEAPLELKRLHFKQKETIDQLTASCNFIFSREPKNFDSDLVLQKSEFRPYTKNRLFNAELISLLVDYSKFSFINLKSLYKIIESIIEVEKSLILLVNLCKHHINPDLSDIVHTYAIDSVKALVEYTNDYMKVVSELNNLESKARSQYDNYLTDNSFSILHFQKRCKYLTTFIKMLDKTNSNFFSLISNSLIPNERRLKNQIFLFCFNNLHFNLEVALKNIEINFDSKNAKIKYYYDILYLCEFINLNSEKDFNRLLEILKNRADVREFLIKKFLFENRGDESDVNVIMESIKRSNQYYYPFNYDSLSLESYYKNQELEKMGLLLEYKK
jgi:hypothetical protein